jgi:hypothetical protein
LIRGKFERIGQRALIVGVAALKVFECVHVEGGIKTEREGGAKKKESRNSHSRLSMII